MIHELQIEIGKWYDHNFGNKPNSLTPGEQLLVVTEELGELAHAYVKNKQKIRTGVDYEAKKIDAVADIFISLASYCNAEDIDLELAIKKVWGEVKQRDWIANPENGLPNAPSPAAVYKPKTIKEVVESIFDTLSREDKNIIADASDMAQFHHIVGTNIRNSFDLWYLEDKNPELYADCCRIGIKHGDDISSIILDWIQSKVKCNGEFDLNSKLIKIWKHWKEHRVAEYLPTNIVGVGEEYIRLFLSL